MRRVDFRFLLCDGTGNDDDIGALDVRRDVTAERLGDELQRLCAGRGKLLAMAERARLMARPRAAEELAESCLRLMRSAA